jgi:hypothetical protein
MLTLFDMTQNWTQITQQTSASATLGSAEIVAQDPVQNGQAQPLSNFGIVDFLGAAINNAAITAPLNEVTLVSAAGNTLAEPSNITGGTGNFRRWLGRFRLVVNAKIPVVRTTRPA